MNSNNSNMTPGNNQTSSVPQTTKMTIPQAFSIIDTKVRSLQLQVEDLKQNQGSSSNNLDQESSAIALKEVVDEYETRFQMFTNELSELTQTVASLATTVTKLQTYTMDVNSMLLSMIIDKEGNKSPIDWKKIKDTNEQDTEAKETTEISLQNIEEDMVEDVSQGDDNATVEMTEF